MRKTIKALTLALALLSCQAVEAAPRSSVWEVAQLGLNPALEKVEIVGFNNAITTTFESIWPESAAYVPLTANMVSPYLASSSAADDVAGTGARTIRVECVDENFVTTTADYDTDGQTSVVLTQDCMVVQNLTILTAGSGGVNAGVIRVGTGVNTAGVPAVTHGHMPIGYNQDQTGIYTVPAGKTLLCRNFIISSKQASAANTTELAFETQTNKGLVIRTQLGAVENGGSNPGVILGTKAFAEKTVINFIALAVTSTGPLYLTVECVKIDNAYLTQPDSIL